MREIRLYLRFVSAFFKARMEYRFSFWSGLGAQLFTHVAEVCGILIILTRFRPLEAWSVQEVTTIYSLNLLSFALAGFFVRDAMIDLERMIATGELDNYLTAPLSPLFHLSVKHFDYYYFAHICVGSVVFFWSISSMELHIDAVWIAYLIASLILGVLVQGSIMIIFGCTSFWFGKSRSLHNAVVYGVRRLVNFPIDIYAPVVQVMLTIGIPYALVGYVPATVLFGKTPDGGALYALLLVVGVTAILCAGAGMIWRAGLRRYDGSGS